MRGWIFRRKIFKQQSWSWEQLRWKSSDGLWGAVNLQGWERWNHKERVWIYSEQMREQANKEKKKSTGKTECRRRYNKTQKSQRNECFCFWTHDLEERGCSRGAGGARIYHDFQRKRILRGLLQIQVGVLTLCVINTKSWLSSCCIDWSKNSLDSLSIDRRASSDKSKRGCKDDILLLRIIWSIYKNWHQFCCEL